MALDGAIVELCAFPEVHAETIRIVEPQSVLMLGLSRLLTGSEARIAGDPRRPFVRFGGLALRPAGVPLEIHVGPGACDTIRIRFDDRRMAAVLDDTQLDDAVLAACFDIRAPSIEDYMLRLAGELERPAPDSPAMAQALVSLLLLDLQRHIKDAARHARRNRGGLSARALRKALEMIDAAGPAPSLDAIADQCGLSRHHFIRCFRQSTNVSPGAAIRRTRIERAKILLIEDDRPVADVARALGYAGAPSFSTAFRRETGRSPSAWRALMR